MRDANVTRVHATVLIVEDEALLRQTMHDYLRDAFPDCRFMDAAHGAGALEACKSRRPDLVLMDKCLPDADGIELTARLNMLYPGIQVIVISYRSGEIYAQSALAAGARAYLIKDNLSAELIPAVAAALGIAPATNIGTSSWKT